MTKEEDMLQNILAVIHRDGGHHTERVGLQQSAEDAMAIVVNMRRYGYEMASTGKKLKNAVRKGTVPQISEAMGEFSKAINGWNKVVGEE